MVQFLQRPRSFGEQIGEQLGSGLSQGIDFAAQAGLEKYKNEQKQKQLMLQGLLKNQGMQHKQLAKQQETVAKEAKDTQGLAETLDFLDENIDYVGNTKLPWSKSFLSEGPLPLNRKGVETRADIDSSGFLAADQVYTHFNKGQISEFKLELIKKELAPNSKLSEREYKARISALRRISKLPRNAPQSVVDKTIDKEIKAVKKIERPALSSFHE